MSTATSVPSTSHAPACAGQGGCFATRHSRHVQAGSLWFSLPCRESQATCDPVRRIIFTSKCRPRSCCRPQTPTPARPGWHLLDLRLPTHQATRPEGRRRPCVSRSTRTWQDCPPTPRRPGRTSGPPGPEPGLVAARPHPRVRCWPRATQGHSVRKPTTPAPKATPPRATQSTQ